MNRMAALAHSHQQQPNEHVRLRENVNKYKEESERVRVHSPHKLSSTYIVTINSQEDVGVRF